METDVQRRHWSPLHVGGQLPWHLVRLSLPQTVTIEVTLDRHDAEILEHFGQLLTDLPEVIEAYLTTG